ncbi:hypothetical protein D9757_005428 [Collybiopsis confluens]|uniref:C3H1-type domain-containing protein n=1 Tax=Collybiopsis confluens TaxID=2823264 RepID=A0A8H5HLE7_9AGAR|nr:hypothetical protein D9757_005428 [Collybiopsis confluens]
MTSAIFKAASEGDLDELQELLKDAANVDVNVKDETGVTPLIAAVKNGHLEVIQTLLANGADPTSASNQAPPQSYSQDPMILELLNSAQSRTIPPHHENGYYPEAYPYYPPPPSEGAVFYPPPPTDSQAAQGPGNLPPPEIARLIPCRYFPACRYGSSCLFAHPQGPYLPGPLPPPARYPAHYDPMNSNYPPNYYPIPPPSFQPPPPNGMNPILSPSNGVSVPPPNGINPMLAPTNGVPVPPPSEMVQPFSPPPVPYGAGTPPASFPQPVSVPIPAMASAYPLPPLPQQQQQPLIPPNMYNNSPPAPFVAQPTGIPQYQPVPLLSYADSALKSPPPISHLDSFPASAPQGPPPAPREPVLAAHSRRGSMPRGSLNSRKPPCLFYPAGRCKNGEDCRFPHILPSEYPVQFTGGRGGAPRGRGHINGNAHAPSNVLDGKMTSMSIRDSRPPTESHAKSDNNRSRISPSSKNGANASNNKRTPLIKQQRVPNADEFPVLGNTISPSSKSAGANGYFNGHAGPTAAQILLAPAPRKDITTVNGTATVSPASSEIASLKESETSTVSQTAAQPTAPKMPISFAAIAANGTPELAAEVSVSA